MCMIVEAAVKKDCVHLTGLLNNILVTIHHFVSVYICTYLCVRVCLCVSLGVCLYVCVCMCVCIMCMLYYSVYYITGADTYTSIFFPGLCSC